MRKKRWVRRTDVALINRYALAALTYALVFGLAALIVLAVLAEVSGRRIGDVLIQDAPLNIALLFALFAFVAYFPARLVHHRSTHRRELDPTEYCGHCGYDLTGNVTGKCPECGGTRAMAFAPDSLFHGRSGLLKWVLASWIAWPVCTLLWLCGTFVPTMFFRSSRLVNVAVVLMYAAAFAYGVMAIALALCFRRLAAGAGARHLSTAVITVATAYEFAMLLLSVAGSTFPLPSWHVPAVRVTVAGWFAAQAGYLAITALVAARVPAKRCAGILGVCAVLVVFAAMPAMAIVFTNSLPSVPMFVWAAGYVLSLVGAILALGALVPTSVKLGKLIRLRVQYERSNEWPIV